MSKVDNNQNDQVSRRSFLKMLGIGGAGVVIGASGAGSIFSFKSMFDTPENEKIVKMRCYHLWTLVNQLD